MLCYCCCPHIFNKQRRSLSTSFAYTLVRLLLLFLSHQQEPCGVINAKQLFIGSWPTKDEFRPQCLIKINEDITYSKT